MKVLPALIVQDNSSSAERRVHALLKECPGYDSSVAFHSLSLAYHATKAMAELDFVVLGPDGVLVLEVKGGGVGQVEGNFFTRDRFGATFAIQNPFTQARTGMFSLRLRLEELLPEERGQFLTGYAVVMPDVQFNVPSLEWDQEQIIDRRDLESPATLSRALKRVYDYWKSRYGERSINGRTAEKIRRCLRPEFERAISISGLVDEASRQQLALTEEQYDFIDTLTVNPRVLCTGGAGTGKTFLLVEVARRAVAQGDQVLVTCHSPLLAEHLAGVLDLDEVTVLPFNELEAYTGPCDVLLVDEAQDVMTLENLMDVLDAKLRGGLMQGRWCMFYDPNLQARIHGRFSADAEKLLRESGASMIPLRRNCRNTREIASMTKIRTGGDIGNAMAGQGLLPREIPWHDRRDQATRIAQIIRECQQDETPPEDILLLSPLPFEQSVVSRLPGGLTVRPWQASGGRGIRFATIDEFKGLESRYVIVADLSHETMQDDALARARLYVAMTRARAALWLLIQDDYRDHLDQLSLGHLQQMKDAGHR